MDEQGIYYKVIELFMEAHYELHNTDWDCLAIELYALLNKQVPVEVLENLDNWSLGSVTSHKVAVIKERRGWANAN